MRSSYIQVVVYEFCWLVYRYLKWIWWEIRHFSGDIKNYLTSFLCFDGTLKQKPILIIILNLMSISHIPFFFFIPKIYFFYDYKRLKTVNCSVLCSEYDNVSTFSHHIPRKLIFILSSIVFLIRIYFLVVFLIKEKKT